MISNATWFFELDRDRFKKVVLKTWDGKTSISVLIHDDLGMAISENRNGPSRLVTTSHARRLQAA